MCFDLLIGFISIKGSTTSCVCSPYGYKYVMEYMFMGMKTETDSFLLALI